MLFFYNMQNHVCYASYYVEILSSSGLKGQLSKTECSFQAQGRHPPQITEALRGKQTVNRDVKTASGLNYLLHHCRNGANIE